VQQGAHKDRYIVKETWQKAKMTSHPKILKVKKQHKTTEIRMDRYVQLAKQINKSCEKDNNRFEQISNESENAAKRKTQ